MITGDRRGPGQSLTDNTCQPPGLRYQFYRSQSPAYSDSIYSHPELSYRPADQTTQTRTSLCLIKITCHQKNNYTFILVVFNLPSFIYFYFGDGKETT